MNTSAAFFRTGLFRFALLLFALPGAMLWGKATPISAELLARKPEFVSVQISPDGGSLAYLRINEDDLMGIEVFNLATGEKKGVAGTEQLDVGGFTWVNDRHIAMTLVEKKIIPRGLYVYDVNSGRLAETYRFQFQGMALVGVPENRKNRVLVRTSGEEGVLQELTTLVDMKNRSFHSNTSAIKSTYPAVPGGRVQGYVSDVTGEPILGFAHNDEDTLIFRLNKKEETWHRVPLDTEEEPIMAVAADGRTAWVARRTSDGGSGVYLYDLVDHRWGKQMYQDPDYDVSGATLVLSKDGKKLQGIQYSRVRAHTEFFDDDLKQAHAKLTAALQGYDVLLTDRSQNQRRVIFRAKSSTEPGQYFLADLDTGAIQHVAASAPWLEGIPLSPTASFNYEARDGLTLQAYLTLPTHEGAKKPFPLMVLGHGGPWARDTWNFNAEVQFLASRGYAVLQPNYRGSTGFHASVSWDDRFDFRKMHDDVTDAVKYLVKGGMVDPAQVGIMGASFGGYLAIAGAAWEPDLYRASITNVGVFDWDMLIADSRRESYSFYYWLMENIGSDPAKVEAFSPLNQADDIKCPVFIAHGIQDIRVDVSQSARLERALKSNGVPHETYYEKDSAHGFAQAEAQAAYLNELDKFLVKYFPTNRAEVIVGESVPVDSD